MMRMKRPRIQHSGNHLWVRSCAAPVPGKGVVPGPAKGKGFAPQAARPVQPYAATSARGSSLRRAGPPLGRWLGEEGALRSPGLCPEWFRSFREIVAASKGAQLRPWGCSGCSKTFRGVFRVFQDVSVRASGISRRAGSSPLSEAAACVHRGP